MKDGTIQREGTPLPLASPSASSLSTEDPDESAGPRAGEGVAWGSGSLAPEDKVLLEPEFIKAFRPHWPLEAPHKHTQRTDVGAGHEIAPTRQPLPVPYSWQSQANAFPCPEMSDTI